MTTATIDTVDFKGLSAFEVQRAIDTYLLNQRVQVERWQQRQREQERQQANRERLAKRAKVCNALKRTGIAVRTQQDSWRTSSTEVSSHPNDEGFYTLTFTHNQTYADHVLRLKAKIQNAIELTHKVEIQKDHSGSLVERWLVKLVHTN
jgi:predicted transposase YbfD/YdcC